MDIMLSNRYSQKRLSLTPNNTYEDAYFMSTPDLVFQQARPESKSKESKEETPNEEKHSWLILASIVCFYVIQGYHNISFGLYYVTFTETFKTTKAAAGLIGSISGASASCCSIIAIVFVDVYGPRPVAVVGSFLASVGIFTSAFATSVYWLYITYGFVIGLGASASNLCVQIVVQQQFNKHRSLATSISMIGIPVGCIISPFITNFLLDTFGWRGTLAIQSAIYLHTVAMCLTFSPPKLTDKHQNNENNTKQRSSTKLLKSLLDCSIVKDVAFLPFLIGTIALRINLVAFIDHTPSRAVFLGLDLKSAGYLITVIFITSLISRISCSVLSAFHLFNPAIGIMCVVATEALCSFMIPFCRSYRAIMAVTAIFGLAQGFMAPSLLLITVKLFGVARFGKARAVMNLLASVGNFAATPLAGWIFDVTQNYDIPYYFIGLIGTISTIAMIILLIIYKVRQHRSTLTSKENDKEDYEFNELEVKRIRTFTC